MYSIDELNFDEPKYEELLSVLINGTCIFIGAGISKLGGYKLWNELSENMVAEYWKRRNDIADSENRFNFSIKTYLSLNSNPIEAMDYLFSLDQNLFFKVLEGNFNNITERLEIYNKFSSLTKIINNFFIQTNIDLGFQKNLNISDDNIAINPIFGDMTKKLTYVHGRLGIKESFIFTRRQYDHSYLNETSAVMRFLIPVFKNYNVVFFGYSLRDFEILQAISKSKMDDQTPKTHYLFEPVYGYKLTEFSIKRTNIKNNFGIEMIPYNIEKGGYDLLFDVLDKLNSTISRKISISTKDAITSPSTGSDTSYER